MNQLISKYLALIFVLSLCSIANAQLINIGPDLLAQDEAFVIKADSSKDRLSFSIDIADEYYLYKDRITVRTILGGQQLAALDLPEGKAHEDEFFGEVAIYRNNIEFFVDRTEDAKTDHLVELVIQGCADVGVCFPPYISEYAFTAGHSTGKLISDNLPDYSSNISQEPISNISEITKALDDKSLLIILVVFFSAGLLLSFTPCVLPMIPIAMAVATGNEKVGGNKAIGLGLLYVLSMASVYTIVGVLTAQAGVVLLTSLLQQVWVLVPLAALFILLGSVTLFELSISLVPKVIVNKVEALRSTQGSISGATSAGIISAIVVSPCVAAPLAGALLFIATTGDVLTGGLALFTLAIGMGMLPLACVFGAGKFLPRTGPASIVVRKFFGILLVALGVWVLGGIVPAFVKMLAYAALALYAALILFKLAKNSSAKSTRFVSIILSLLMTVFGAVMLVGGATRGNNEFAPLAHLLDKDNKGLEFEVVSTLTSYSDIRATSYGKKTFEYYYADWCVSCRELEAYTFSDKKIKEALKDYRLIKIDLTKNDEDSSNLLSIVKLLGPPAIIVRDTDGTQLLRYVGYIEYEELLAAIQQVEQYS